MNSNDQQPERRRKLSLNKKTPTRLRSDANKDLICTPTSAHIPIPKKSLRNLKNVHQNIESSDESSAEIGWDNNSPSPSTCAKPSKRNCNGGNIDITNIFKNVPAQKKMETKDEGDQRLKTWMTDEYVLTYSAGKSTKKNNKTLRTQTQRKKARSKQELVSVMLSMKSMIKTELEENDSVPVEPIRSMHNGEQVFDEGLLNTSPIKSLFSDDSPPHQPSYESPVSTVPKISESTPLPKCPSAQSLVPDDNLDNINWSYVETPGVKKPNSIGHADNSRIKNVACKALYDKEDASKTIKPSESVGIETAPLKTDDNSLMNIDFDDMDGCGSAIYTEIADTVPIHSEPTAKALFTENIAQIESKASSKSTCDGEILIESNSLMNIDFDDDLDEFLSTQPLDTMKCEDGAAGCSKTTKEIDLPVLDDDQDMSIMDDKDVSMLLEDPLAVEQDECMVSQNSSILDDKDANMLILDDNLSDVLDGINARKDGMHNKNSPNNYVENAALTNVNKETLRTPNRKSNIDLIGFDDDADDLFDDIIVSLDGGVKCKSQETPPQSITSDQRKMKSKCHTSPFPISSKRTLLLKNDSRNLDDPSVTSNSNKQSSRNDFSNTTSHRTKEKDFKEATLKRPPDKPTSELNKKGIGNKSSMMKTNGIQFCDSNISKSNNPNKNGYEFKNNAKTLSFNNNKNSCRKPPLDVSIIAAKENRIEEEDNSIYIAKPGMRSDHFTSTQKCSMDEIQRKREEAKMKLKQRSRLKR